MKAGSDDVVPRVCVPRFRLGLVVEKSAPVRMAGLAVYAHMAQPYRESHDYAYRLRLSPGFQTFG